MPHRKTKHKKVQKLEDDNGWTHVVRGPRLPSSELGRTVSGNIGDKLSQIKATSTLSLDLLRSKYAKSQKYWEEDPLRHRFEQIFTGQIIVASPGLVIDSILVLGLGTMATDNMDSNSMHQLVLLGYWIKFLRTKYAIPKVHFQDPQFSANDRTFLEESGYSVVDDPEAYLLLTPTTFLFTPYLPWEITHTFWYVSVPALFIGNDFSSQLSLGLFQERQTILQSPLIHKYYSSCKRLPLDCRHEREALDGPKHARWLVDVFVYWSSNTENQNHDDNGNKLDLFDNIPENRCKPEIATTQQEDTQTDKFLFRAGPGEWRSDGYVFDSKLWMKIQAAQQRRALQPG